MERAVTFDNGSGLALHGVLHLPEARAHTGVGVLLLSPGQKCRTGPWRSYVRLARRLAAQGVPVLRFDFHGLGDSDGEHPHGRSLVDFNGFVQTGGLSGDVRAATAFFAREAGVSRFVFAGLCGGASTGLIAAKDLPAVHGLVLVDLPVTVSSAARQRYLEQHAAEMLRLRPEESHGVLRDYLARLRDPAAWRRLASGASDYRLLLETVRQVVATRLLHPARERLARLWPRRADPDRGATPPAARTEPEAGGPAHEQLNAAIVDAFFAARVRGQRLFFLNSATYHPMFERYFGARHLPQDRADWHGLGLLVVPESNHVFSHEHAQRALFEAVEEFVRGAIAELAERASLPPRPSRPGADVSPGGERPR